MSKNYGFARCSLGEEKGQDLNRQVRELKAAGAEEIITERVHGDAKVKPQLDFLLEHIEPNSSLYVTPFQYSWASLVAQTVKNLPAIGRPGFSP